MKRLAPAAALALLLIVAPLLAAVPAGAQQAEVGVELIGFDETARILETAAGYTELGQIPWFGSDGSALSAAVINNPVASEFADKTNWSNTIAFFVNDKAVRVYCYLKQKLGSTPDPYSLIAYDALYVLALAIAKAGPDNVTGVAQAIPEVVKNYEGVSGQIVLDEYGDRVATDYGVFQVVKEGDKYTWRLKKIWHFQNEKFEDVKQDPYANCPQVEEPQVPEQPPEGYTVVTIGALLPITGDLASFGPANKESILLAAKDVNKYFMDNGIKLWIKVEVVDTGTDPATAKDRFLALYNKGIRFFVGPMSSGELGEVINAIQQGYTAVVISQSSTAPSLKLKDTVYRFPPPDELQGKVLAQLISQSGVKKLIIVYRNDDWGAGLAGFVEQYFKQMGGEVIAKIPYDPKNPNPTSVVEQIYNAYQQAAGAAGGATTTTGGGAETTTTTEAGGGNAGLIAGIIVVIIIIVAAALLLRKK